MSWTPEERVLVDGCRRGDEEAWRALYRAYAPDVGRYLRGMVGGAADPDDLVQRVFLEFLRSLEGYRGDASIRTWLHRIARHVALRSRRGHQRRQRRPCQQAAPRWTRPPRRVGLPEGLG